MGTASASFISGHPCRSAVASVLRCRREAEKAAVLVRAVLVSCVAERELEPQRERELGWERQPLERGPEREPEREKGREPEPELEQRREPDPESERAFPSSSSASSRRRGTRRDL